MPHMRARHTAYLPSRIATNPIVQAIACGSLETVWHHLAQFIGSVISDRSRIDLEQSISILLYITLGTRVQVSEQLMHGPPPLPKDALSHLPLRPCSEDGLHPPDIDKHQLPHSGISYASTSTWHPPYPLLLLVPAGTRSRCTTGAPAQFPPVRVAPRTRQLHKGGGGTRPAAVARRPLPGGQLPATGCVAPRLVVFGCRLVMELWCVVVQGFAARLVAPACDCP